jgi:glutamine cyclotransferase
MPAKGKATQIEGVSVLRFRDGKIAAERDFWNVADLLQQISALNELYPPTPLVATQGVP